MSGLVRNLWVILRALLYFRTAQPLSQTRAHFFVTPFDTGLVTLKSDKYLQLVEAAQFDYLIKTALIGEMLAKRYSFVNAAQSVWFVKPIRLFDRVRVESQLAYLDEKCGYFCHRLIVGQVLHAEVFVKMKFKRGSVTVAPEQLLGAFNRAKPMFLQRWDEALATASQ